MRLSMLESSPVPLHNSSNIRGQVVGFSTLQGEAITRAFLWEDGVMTDLGSLSGTLAEPMPSTIVDR